MRDPPRRRGAREAPSVRGGAAPASLAPVRTRPGALGAAIVGLALASACAPARAPAPTRAPPLVAPSPPNAPAPAGPGPRLRLVLRPARDPSPHVHVEFFAEGASTRELRAAAGAPGAIEGLAVEDERGAIGVGAAEAAPGAGFAVRLERASAGPLRVRYDVRASADPHARPGEVVVAEDRFRADGEALLLFPAGFEALEADLSVTVEGEAIEAPEAASSLGVGRTRTRRGRAGALRRSSFLAGSLGKARFDDGFDRDESAWLGYTAFDPRPAVAEIAQVRTAMRELWQGGGEAEHGLFFVSTRRPPGSYALAGRASSLVAYLGPSEPWSAALRLGIAQHLMRPWVGGELALRRPEGPAGPEASWLSEGLARYLAARVLSRLGLLAPGDVQGFVNGLLAAQATAPRGAGGERDPAARASRVARAALYAARVDAAIRAKSKGARSIDDVVRDLLRRARATTGPAPATGATDAVDGTGGTDGTENWVDALVAELGPGERRAFAEQVGAGGDVVLPAGALGRCFRVRRAEYATFALGFDAGATFETPGRVVAGLEPEGPAAAAGLRPGDAVDDVAFRDGDPGEPATLSVKRGGQALTLRYLPRGRRGRGPRFERAPGFADPACQPVL